MVELGSALKAGDAKRPPDRDAKGLQASPLVC